MPGRRCCRTLVVVSLLWVTTSAISQNTEPSPPKETTFSYQAASELLNQIGAGLTSHSQKKLLASFDLTKMTNGPLFRMQTSTLMAQTAAIRVHFNLLEVVMEGEKGVASVDIEMEADSRDPNVLPLHKQARLRMVAENSSSGWKFVDVDPRSFFSVQP